MTSLRDGELETAAEMAEALRRRRVSPLDILERALARAEAWQPSTNAFSQPLWSEEAEEDARLVELAFRALARSSHPSAARPVVGQDDLPLTAGVPIAVKDLYDVSGHETTGCSEAYRGSISLHDAEMVVRVREAGMVLVGKTNQHELAHGGTNLVSAVGRTGNPWDPARMTGGSSGGSAAAVATGVVPWALGSDTGGSVRIPASMCGVFGLKPTTGRLSIQGMLPLAPSMDTPGPLASTATDLTVLYRVMTGHSPDQAGDDEPVDGAPLRLARPRGPFDQVHPTVADAVADVSAVFASAGVTVERSSNDSVAMDLPEGIRGIWHRLADHEFLDAHRSIAGRRDTVDPSVAVHFDHAESLSPDDLADALRRQGDVSRWFRRQLEAVDALLVPTTPYPAPRADDTDADVGPAGRVEIARVGPGWLTCLVNLAGLPAVNLPAGRTPEGLPVGVTLVGRDDAEFTLLRLAALWEREGGYHPARPPVPAISI
jgi:aspartyl-tRNA(Asn)/glutamyl-tRNA(Gln) amidotransferase subunit A